MTADTAFWQFLGSLVRNHSVIVDRPRGSPHPRYKDVIYPLDYGYLENTTASDGSGIDVWIGSLNTMGSKAGSKTLTGILCTFDTLKRDAEIKLLIGCNEADIQIIRDFHKQMQTLYIPNPVVEHDISN